MTDINELEKYCHEFRLKLYWIHNMKTAYMNELGVK